MAGLSYVGEVSCVVEVLLLILLLLMLPAGGHMLLLPQHTFDVCRCFLKKEM